MYLKSLTLRGFKSFAATTRFAFEPGITCIVGPNGSGKSNVVDAFSWVMGEQGSKPLRGGKMEDVVFAGTAGRPALGRAEVTLTIDNSDGSLPIEYSEVTISRLLFRSGQSEYAINGDQCRLLDVAELLSDTGLGREMHVIVNQGHLDDVLNAGPQVRRALIEEAAGVLKHRRRKEKAVRKLDAMQANLTRLVDLTAELGRRLKPLGRQAEIARKAQVIQAELRDARLRLLADEYAALARHVAQDTHDERVTAQQRVALAAELDRARDAEAELERAEQQHSRLLAAAQESFFALGGLAERLRAVQAVAAERQRNLSAPEPPRAGRDPAEMEDEATQLRAQERQLQDRLTGAREQLTTSVAGRARAEAALAENERRLAADAEAAARRGERIARLRGQVDSALSRAAAAKEEQERLAEALVQARAGAEQSQLEYAALQDLSAGREHDRADLAGAHERSAAALAEATDSVTRLRAAEHAASEELAGLRARVAALSEVVAKGADASGTVLGEPGVLGPLAELISVDDGARLAVAAALGAASGAVAVTDLDSAAAILSALKERDAGRAWLAIAQPQAGQAGWAAATAGSGFTPLMQWVQCAPELAAAVEALLGDVLACGDLAEGLELVRANPGLRVVTWDGDVLGAHWVQGGSGAEPGLLELRAAADLAADELGGAEGRWQRAQRRLAAAVEDEEQARQALGAALAALHEADAAAAETSGRLGSLAGRARAARDEAARLSAAIAAAEKSRKQSLAQADELAAQLAGQEEAASAAADAAPEEATAAGRQQLAEAAVSARGAEMDARLEVRTAEERLRAISGRADAMASAAAAERQAATLAQARARRRAEGAQLAASVEHGARIVLERIAASRAAADSERQAAEDAHSRRDAELRAVRAKIKQAAQELDKVVDSAHAAELARATRQLQRDQVADRALEEFAVGAAELVAEYGPGVPVPDADGGAAVAFDRARQEQRAAAAQRKLDHLGKVNPLALEEFAALQERHAFLVTQLEDLRKTRRDLLTVIKEVDERVQQVFAAAFEDVAREFADVIGRLFPGGEGRLVLTEPDDLLATGIEVEARPPGKRVRRLTLLSGGERAMAAIAFLIAIFRARPSPFYVLDEVEAALDDTNLQRLLEILAELREASQLIIVTHQKRTMEVADTLYGISMRGDGVSTVISQRLREREVV